MRDKEQSIDIRAEIIKFVADSPLNRKPDNPAQYIFEKPLIGVASADDPLFQSFKQIISPFHLTPREILALDLHKDEAEIKEELFVISWILPVATETRISNRKENKYPSWYWAVTRWYGEKFNDALRNHVVEQLKNSGFLAVAPSIQSFFKTYSDAEGPYSNWSERHVAYAAGLGTFSLSDGFITEKGIAHRCGSVVTNLPLVVNYRSFSTAFANCLYYADGSCRACISRCPANAITESGHDKIKCLEYQSQTDFKQLRAEWRIGNIGCGLCQTGVPCENKNPVPAKIRIDS